MSGEVNPNVDVGDESGEKKVAPGEVVSFNDLPDDVPPPKAKDDKEAEVKGEKAKEDGDKTSDADSEGSGSPDGDGGSDQADQEEDRSPEDDDSEAAEDEGPIDDTEAEVRTVKAKHGKDELELYGDTVVPTKVAGKLEQPTLTDLQSNYSGKVNWDRKNNELHQQRVQFQKESQLHTQQVGELNEFIDTLVNESKTDPLKMWDLVAELHGEDPVQMKLDLIKSQVAQVEPIVKMGEDERERYFKKLELEFREQKITSKEKLEKATQEKQAQTQQLQETCDKYGLTQEEYLEYKSQAKEYKQEGEVTPQDVVLVSRHVMATEAVHKARQEWVEGLNPQSEADVKNYNDFVDSIRKMALDNPGWTQDDLVEVIEGAFGDQATDNLGRKLKKSQPNPQGNVTKPKPKKQRPLTFDDL